LLSNSYIYAVNDQWRIVYQSSKITTARTFKKQKFLRVISYWEIQKIRKINFTKKKGQGRDLSPVNTPLSRTVPTCLLFFLWNHFFFICISFIHRYSSLRFWVEQWMYWFYNDVCIFIFFYFCVCLHLLGQ